MNYGLLLLVALGCGGKPPPPTVAPEAAPLELTFQTFAEAGTAQRPVAMGSTLHTGDKIALSVTVTSPAYIYVVQFFPDGQAGVLYPRPNEDHPISGTQRIPGTGWFELDQVVGEENVYVIASKQALAQADAAVKRTIDDVRAGKQAVSGVATGKVADGSATTKTDGPGPQGVEAPRFASRGLTRVEADNSIRATADAQGVAVFRFSFSHAAK